MIRLKRFKRKLACVIGCTMLIAQMPTTYVNATETNAVQEGKEEAKNQEAEGSSTKDSVDTNGTTEPDTTGTETTETNTTETNTTETNTTETNTTETNTTDQPNTEEVESTKMKDEVNQLPYHTIEETSLIPNSSSLEAQKGTADANGFVIENGVLTDYTGSGGVITIPSGVTSIGQSAFWECTSITEVTIPKEVESIGALAFWGCSNLDKINIPSSVTNIGERAFKGCNKLSNNMGFVIVNSVLYDYCGDISVTNISVPEGVTKIGSITFLGCSNLISVSIPSSVTSIEERAFSDCANITEVTMQNGLTSIEGSVFQGCSNLQKINIPSSVESIGYLAFKGCTSITEVTMHIGLTSIGYATFYGCSNLKRIDIPSSVTSIGDSAFRGCEGLANYEGFVVVNEILYDYFDKGGATNISIPDRVKRIGKEAFSSCSRLTSITIPSSVTSIGAFAFDSCSGLTSITIPSSVTSIENNILENCDYSKLTIYSNKDSAIHQYITNNNITAAIVIMVDSVHMNESNLNLNVGQTTTLTATVLPDNAFNKNVTWSSSDSNVASVDNTGNITIVSSGTASITATTQDGNKAATCTIQVKQVEPEKPVEPVTPVNVESVSIKESTLNLATGQTITLTAAVLPDNAINKNVTWSTSDSNIATVDNTGNVTALSPGTAIITTITQDGNKTATCNINVSILVNAIKLNSTKLTLGINAQIKLKATTSPENATSTNVTWTSSNPNVATVSSEGIVKAIALGTADITATAQEGSNVTNTCKLTVSKNKSYKLTYKLNKGQNADLNPSYYPIKTKLKLINPTRKGYTFAGWYVGDKKVTSIDKKSTGKITVTAKWKKTSVDKTTIKKANNNKAGSIAVSFDKVSGAKGYTVYYSTDKKLKNASEINVNSKKKSATITNLEKGTTYYVTVKAYKTDSEGNRVYGKSSKTMKVKIKK